jgi:hypothetical protein
MTDTLSTKIEKPESPEWQEYTVVPQKIGQQMNPDGVVGFYKVIFVLSKPGVTVSDISPASNDQGDTYILLRDPNDHTPSAINRLKFSITDRSGNLLEYFLDHNNKGNISSISIDSLQAKSFADAISSAYRYVAPLISQISYQMDSAIAINKIDAIEILTGSQRYFCLVEGKTKPLHLVSKPTSVELAALLSFYREAINSSYSPFYQVFLFYKIILGCYAIRGNLARQSKPLTKIVELVPQGYLHIGKSFGWVRDHVRDNFRNNFAHFNIYNPTQTLLSPDEMTDIYTCLLLIPEVKYIAKSLIEAVCSDDTPS